MPLLPSLHSLPGRDAQLVGAAPAAAAAQRVGERVSLTLAVLVGLRPASTPLPSDAARGEDEAQGRRTRSSANLSACFDEAHGLADGDAEAGLSQGAGRKSAGSKSRTQPLSPSIYAQERLQGAGFANNEREWGVRHPPQLPPAAATPPLLCRVLAAFNCLPLWLPCTWDASQQDLTGLHHDRITWLAGSGSSCCIVASDKAGSEAGRDGRTRHGVHGEALDQAVRAARVQRRQLDALGQRNMQAYAGEEREQDHAGRQVATARADCSGG